MIKKGVSMKKYCISVIIINFNSADYTRECIDSIKEKTSKDLSYQIIIVDNNSNPEDQKRLSDLISGNPDIILIKSKINLGFSAGNMLGIQYANADYIFFLNNDTVLLNDCLSILYNFMKSNEAVGICTGQMYNSDMSFHHSFNYFPTLALKVLGSSFLRIFNGSKYPQKKIKYIHPLQVDFVTGAAIFTDYSKFARVGGFDTNYFLYCEEEDIAKKMDLAGYSVFLVPEAKFIHHMGKSTNHNFDIEKENMISTLYYHRKYSNYITYIFIKTWYFIKKAKYFYKSLNKLKLAFFILSGAHLKHSLKHKQVMKIE